MHVLLFSVDLYVFFFSYFMTLQLGITSLSQAPVGEFHKLNVMPILISYLEPGKQLHICLYETDLGQDPFYYMTSDTLTEIGASKWSFLSEFPTLFQRSGNSSLPSLYLLKKGWEDS